MKVQSPPGQFGKHHPLAGEKFEYNSNRQAKRNQWDAERGRQERNQDELEAKAAARAHLKRVHKNEFNAERDNVAKKSLFGPSKKDLATANSESHDR